MKSVNIKTYPPPPICEKEILRYMGVPCDDGRYTDLIRECMASAVGVLDYKVCYTELPISVLDDAVDLGFALVRSDSLRRALVGCRSIILFAATVGIGMDRLIVKSAVRSPLYELVSSAIGTERVESFCDEFCRELALDMSRRSCGIRPRFSPGYGDLPLELQRDVFRVLDCPKNIGVSIGQSLLMTPQKSVTAIVGIYDL